ncbi:MAG TPA: prepilin-type N-terminal cleavage/methylation domain-containing protein [Verrucomicrobiae bacterium]|nr:prepilin-type N-terminal cleavage/methylation domain-containing protein [Verrucomicrobiae bacterium]
MHLLTPLSCRRRFKGFTLVEGLIGVAVMGVVFVSLYTGMASGFQSIRASQENLRATQIMVGRFESLRLYNWDQINTAGFIPDTFTTQFAPNSSNPGITYTGTIRIAAVPGAPYTVDLRAVTITLTWKTGSRARTRTLTSYVARYGLQNYIY